MNDELCILFAYHKVDKLTLHHFELLKMHNSNYRIIPITDNISEYLPGTVDVSCFADDPWEKARPWRRCDTMLYRWFLNREVSAKRYLLLEYDVLCNVDVYSEYADVWDADIAARDYYLPGMKKSTRFGKDISREWFHFREITRIGDDDRSYAAGLVPLVGILFSHNGLNSIVKNVVRNDVFCELRIGTAARKSGLIVRKFPQKLRNSIRWDTHFSIPKEPGIYHSIKFLDDPKTILIRRMPRNAPCPCDSGKKYKHCHGQLESASIPYWEWDSQGNKFLIQG